MSIYYLCHCIYAIISIQMIRYSEKLEFMRLYKVYFQTSTTIPKAIPKTNAKLSIYELIIDYISSLTLH
jgi:hypothetical protein